MWLDCSTWYLFTQNTWRYYSDTKPRLRQKQRPRIKWIGQLYLSLQEELVLIWTVKLEVRKGLQG